MAELEGPTSELEIASAREGEDVSVLRVSGQLDISNASILERALNAAVADDPRAIVFDLAGLEFMDSAGISVLVRARSEVGEVSLRNPTPVVRRLIEITGLSEVLPIEGDAVAP